MGKLWFVLSFYQNMHNFDGFAGISLGKLLLHLAVRATSPPRFPCGMIFTQRNMQILTDHKRVLGREGPACLFCLGSRLPQAGSVTIQLVSADCLSVSAVQLAFSFAKY